MPVPSENCTNGATNHRPGDKASSTSLEPVSTQFDARVHEKFMDDGETAIGILLRHSGNFTMAILESSSVHAGTFAVARSLNAESVLRVFGLELGDDECKMKFPLPAKITLRITQLWVLSHAKTALPRSVASHGAPGEEQTEPNLQAMNLQNRLDNRILDVRVAATGAIHKLYSGIHELAVEKLRVLDFYCVPVPKLIGFEFPGDEHEQFAIDYFGKEKAWLSQAGDPHLEMALSADLERVYDLHTVFRREQRSDGRHLTEFTSLDVLWALKNDWTEIMDLTEDFLKFVISSMQKQSKYRAHTTHAKKRFPLAGTINLGLDDEGRLMRIEFARAKSLLRDPLGWQTGDDEDITQEQEAALGRYLASGESIVGPPTDVFFITHYPRSLRTYNVYPGDDGTTRSFDVIMRGQEICTGYQCIHEHDKLRSAMASRRHPIDPESTAWKPFVSAHDAGMPPVGGVSFGLNRILQGFLGASDIRETVLFPRDAERLRP